MWNSSQNWKYYTYLLWPLGIRKCIFIGFVIYALKVDHNVKNVIIFSILDTSDDVVNWKWTLITEKPVQIFISKVTVWISLGNLLSLVLLIWFLSITEIYYFESRMMITILFIN